MKIALLEYSGPNSQLRLERMLSCGHTLPYGLAVGSLGIQIAFSDDGERVAVAYVHEGVSIVGLLFDRSTGMRQLMLQIPHETGIYPLLAPGARYLQVTDTVHSTTRMVDLTLSGHTIRTYPLAFQTKWHPISPWLATWYSSSDLLTMLSVAENRTICHANVRLHGHRIMSWSRNGKYLYVKNNNLVDGLDFESSSLILDLRGRIVMRLVCKGEGMFAPDSSRHAHTPCVPFLPCLP